MQESENDILLIEKYLQHDLDSKETEIFHARLESSLDFREELELKKSMLAAIRSEDKTQLLKEFEQLTFKETNYQSRTKKITWYYSAAAAISIIIVSALLLRPSTDDLMQDHFIPFPEQPITRNVNGTVGIYKEAMQHYSLGNYDRSLESFSQIEDNTKEAEICLYKGNALLALDKAREAIPLLVEAQMSKNQPVQIHAQWYLALAYLGADKKEESLSLLNKIASDKNLYQEKAQNLISDLKWVW